jgi:hypothetical protein
MWVGAHSCTPSQRIDVPKDQFDYLRTSRSGGAWQCQACTVLFNHSYHSLV